jgi:hypothetical protein
MKMKVRPIHVVHSVAALAVATQLAFAGLLLCDTVTDTFGTIEGLETGEIVNDGS